MKSLTILHTQHLTPQIPNPSKPNEKNVDISSTSKAKNKIRKKNKLNWVKLSNIN